MDQPDLRAGSGPPAGSGEPEEPLGLRTLKTFARPADAATLAAILLTAAVAWAYLLGSPAMPGAIGGEMAGMDMAPGVDSWSWREGLLLFVMWAVMMVAMMLPAAAPMILLFSKVGATRSARGGRPTPVVFFVLGYLVVWWGFSALAAVTQWHLHRTALLSFDMRLATPIGAVVLVAAGIYQWLPLKQSCLRLCRSPLGFLSTSWREGQRGAFVMGLTHGAFCLGCCWMLMALLFAAGVMSPAWVAVLAAVLLMEKIFPAGPAIARVAGILFVGVGLALLV